MKTISVINLKGGVGKSTTSINLAYELVVRYGKRVLLVDTDQNRGATKLLLPPEPCNTITSLITGLCAYPYDLIYNTEYERLDIIAADEELAAYGTNSFARKDCNVNAISDMCEALAEDDAYDYVIIDSAPGMAAAFVCAVAASNSIIIPMTLDFWGVSGMQDLMVQINGVREVKPNIKISGSLVTMFRRDEDAMAGLAQLRAESPIPVYPTVIRWSKKVWRAMQNRKTLGDAAPRCAAAIDYRKWVAEFLSREEGEDNEQFTW